MRAPCECMTMAWLWEACPFYLECLDDNGYTTYCLLVRNADGMVTGYHMVLEHD